MTERDDFYSSARFEEPMQAVEREKRRLDDVSDMYRTETTTVHAKGRAFTMTFDGRGDLTKITFNGTRFRTMAPAELAELLVSTLQAGRLQSLEKVSALMADSMPGMDFLGLATGKVDPREALDAMIGPLLSGLDVPSPPQRPDPRAGWES